jgi:hypothetical protein
MQDEAPYNWCPVCLDVQIISAFGHIAHLIVPMNELACKVGAHPLEIALIVWDAVGRTYALPQRVGQAVIIPRRRLLDAVVPTIDADDALVLMCASHLLYDVFASYVNQWRMP